jgi:hypothetical protein
MKEKYMFKPTEHEPTSQYKKMNVIRTQAFWNAVSNLRTASWRVNKMFNVLILIFRAGIAAGRVLGSYFLLSRLIGNVYHEFVQNFLSELL